MLRRFSILLCLLVLCAPVAAHAQSSPFAPLPPATTAPEPTPTVSSSSSSDGGGLKAWQQILIFGGGAILLFGIGFAILADARSVAPTIENTEERETTRKGREADLKRRKAKARAADKRSRQARKRNR
ncbi:MAG: hypothetical protein QOF26_9 [Baekduia sp.]|jgi:hypothetical protein|nr:hypothetical protein [Baekduia sp.]MDX6699783.1 hypothetical protein [Baekduia sp.]